ncbi:hypothetical protein BPAE_0004g00490 [Botrytis paeoniae]|uniref:3'-5' exoribonuclease Rv2179c-like domain-containing protein n=1 Tax=Botrytis paeoniae TaxID=278948 RepID=A0A4Z1G599_9HELO|nr:hypothetical protein BPAE_0004g00490 [Botrytis paeoniae]
MPPEALYVNIMVDCELAGHLDMNKPAITQIGAAFFDIETGEERSRFEEFPNLQSCLTRGLVRDHVTIEWVDKNCPEVLMISQKSTTTLKEALQAFTTWIKRRQKSTRETIRNSGGRYRFGGTLLWANGSMQDNRWLHFAYEACELIQPVEYFQYRCAMTANYTAELITKRNFRREADRVRRGKRHDTVKDCLHQIGWLVNGLNTSMRNQAPRIPSSASSVTSGSPVHERLSRRRRLDYDDE